MSKFEIYDRYQNCETYINWLQTYDIHTNKYRGSLKCTCKLIHLLHLKISSGDAIPDKPLELFVYEHTQTFNSYYTLTKALNYCATVALDYLTSHAKKDGGDLYFNYCIEYHENGRPHLHFQVFRQEDLEAQTLRNIDGQMSRKYGKPYTVPTDKEDKYHAKSDMKWSEYIKKDIIKNEANGQKHYFEYFYKH